MRATRTLLFAVALLASVAQLEAGERAFGIGLGLTTGPDVSPYRPLYLAASVRQRLTPRLAIEPEVGWHRLAHFGEDDFSVGGSLALVLPSGQFEAWAGLGPNVFLYHISDDEGYTASGSHLGFHLAAGLDRRVSRSVVLFAAARHEVGYGSDDYVAHRWMFYVGLRLGR